MPERSLLRRVGGVALAIAGLTATLAVLRPAVRCFRAEIACFHPPRNRVMPPENDPDLQSLSEVAFSSGADVLRGWYLPAQNGAAVLLVHGSSADRSSLLPEAKILHRAGFGVLLFDMPGHGESGGFVSWGAPERESVRAAARWLATRPEVNRERIGAFGFSMGGYIVAQTAPDEPLIRAVVLAGTPSDAAAQTRWEYRRAGWLGQTAALFADRVGGMRFDAPQPLHTVAAIAPRPILFVSGTRDEVVPPEMVEELYRAARDPKRLYIVKGAEHGDYEKASGAAYSSELVGFFTRWLAEERAAGR